MTLHLPTPGNWCGVVNLQTQGAPGSRCEVSIASMKGQDWNATICKSPTMDTLRKSSGTFDRSSLSQKTHKNLTWRRMYWSWGLFMSTTMKASVHLGPNYNAKFGSIQEYQLRTAQEIVWYHPQIDIGTWGRNSECIYDWLERFLMHEIFA